MADRAKIAEAELEYIVVEVTAIGLCNEIQHHLAPRTTGLEAAGNVDPGLDSLS